MFDLYFLWLIVAVVLAGADMLLGTFYLLILGLSAIAAFVIAVVGLSFTAQLLGFALFGIIGCVLLSLKKKNDTGRKTLDAAQIQNLNDGQIVTVEHWKEDGTADVFFPRHALAGGCRKRSDFKARSLVDHGYERKHFNY